LGFFDFFRKKTEEELFQEAVNQHDYVEIVKYGEKLLEKNPENFSVLNPYVDALVKLGNKDRAVNLLLDLAEKKVKEEYYDLAIPILKKAFKIDPLNIRTIRLLSSAYKSKELFYDAFKVLTESFKRYKEAGFNTEAVKELLENFIQEQFHPLFYEKYGDLLSEEGNQEQALVNYVLAGNMFLNLQNYKAALRALLKARKIKRSENIDRQIIEAIAHLGPEVKPSILATILTEYASDVNFLKDAVELFKKSGNLAYLKRVALELKAPKLKYILLSLINFELGEVEEGQEYLEKLKILDKDAYERVLVTIKSKYEDVLPAIEGEAASIEELPEPEQILEVLDQVLDVEDLVSEYVESIEEETPEAISREIVALRELGKDGKRYVSAAEALLGLEKYDEAVKTAREALDTEEAFRAVAIIGEAYRQKGDYRKALSFLFDQLESPLLSEEEKARLKILVADVYREMGDREKALYWYKEANKVLKDEEIERKVEELSASANERI